MVGVGDGRLGARRGPCWGGPPHAPAAAIRYGSSSKGVSTSLTPTRQRARVSARPLVSATETAQLGLPIELQRPPSPTTTTRRYARRRRAKACHDFCRPRDTSTAKPRYDNSTPMRLATHIGTETRPWTDHDEWAYCTECTGSVPPGIWPQEGQKR